MKKTLLLIWVLIGFISLFQIRSGFAQEESDYEILREIVVNEFQKEIPLAEESQPTGMIQHFKTKEKKTALILEACLDNGAELDLPLIKTLIEKKIATALFTDQAWLEKNAASIKPLLASGLLVLENHGLFCRPLSVNGQGIKNHTGTADVSEAFEEIEKNARAIEKFSGRMPRFFKSGFGFYDDVALKIVSVLGYQAVEGDMKLLSKDVASEATLSAFLDKIQPGSMIVMPVNRPGASATWLPQLLNGIAQRGYGIVALDAALGSDEDRL